MKLAGSRRTLSRASRRPSSRLPAASSCAEAPATTSGSRQLEVSAPTCVATAALRGVAAVVVAQARAEEHDRRGGDGDDGEPHGHGRILGHSRIAKTWPIQPPTANVPERSKPWRSYQATSGGARPAGTPGHAIVRRRS